MCVSQATAAAEAAVSSSAAAAAALVPEPPGPFLVVPVRSEVPFAMPFNLMGPSFGPGLSPTAPPAPQPRPERMPSVSEYPVASHQPLIPEGGIPIQAPNHAHQPLSGSTAGQLESLLSARQRTLPLATDEELARAAAHGTLSQSVDLQSCLSQWLASSPAGVQGSNGHHSQTSTPNLTSPSIPAPVPRASLSSSERLAGLSPHHTGVQAVGGRANPHANARHAVGALPSLHLNSSHSHSCQPPFSFQSTFHPSVSAHAYEDQSSRVSLNATLNQGFSRGDDVIPAHHFSGLAHVLAEPSQRSPTHAIHPRLPTQDPWGPALTPSLFRNAVSKVSHGPRVKTTIRTSTFGTPTETAVHVIGSRRAVPTPESPRGVSPSPRATSPAAMDVWLQHHRAQLPSSSPDAGISGTTVTDSPRPSADSKAFTGAFCPVSPLLHRITARPESATDGQHHRHTETASTAQFTQQKEKLAPSSNHNRSLLGWQATTQQTVAELSCSEALERKSLSPDSPSQLAAPSAEASLPPISVLFEETQAKADSTLVAQGPPVSHVPRLTMCQALQHPSVFDTIVDTVVDAVLNEGSRQRGTSTESARELLAGTPKVAQDISLSVHDTTAASAAEAVFSEGSRHRETITQSHSEMPDAFAPQPAQVVNQQAVLASSHRQPDVVVTHAQLDQQDLGEEQSLLSGSILTCNMPEASAAATEEEEDWNPDDEAMQAASALAGMAESHWQQGKQLIS